MTALLVVAGVALLWRLAGGGAVPFLSEPCRATGPDGTTVRMSSEQVGNAATVALVGRRLGVGERGVTIALATAMQESKLRNLEYGDRDSLGLFQQRPSQGWGTPEQVRDPVHASERFFTALEKIKRYEDLPLTQAAQAVQRSGFPDAYAEHEREASALAGALTGRVPGGLTCALRAGGDLEPEQVTASGLTRRAEAVRRELERAAGAQRLGGFAPGGVGTGHPAGSAHDDGRAVDVFYRPVSEASRRAGWATAHYLVANADRLGIATVIYDERIWTAARSAQGWREDVPADADPAGEAGRHLDHVHVEVLRGG